MMIFGFYAITVCLASGALGMPGAILSEYQDSLGQYSFGYSSPVSARSEVRSVDGKIKGAFSFVDDSGVIQTAKYTADREGGFRIEASYLPEAPQPVEDAPEVVAAREDHFKAVAEAERLEKVQQTAEIQNSDNLTMKDDKPTMMAVERQEGLEEENKKENLLTRMKEHESVEKSENVEAAVVKSSFIMPASKLSLQRRIELQPMGQPSGAPITTIPQGLSATKEFAGLANLRGAAIISPTTGYSPYSALLVSPYTSIYPYGHYPFA